MLELLFLNLLLISQLPTANQQFRDLESRLEKAGFQVILKLPPRRGAYGLLEENSKTIWVNPIVVELHVATQTLIYEAVHAAQVCKGKGKIVALGLDIQPSNYARPFFSHYPNNDRQNLETEAYAVQTQSNRSELAISLLQQHCR